MAAIVTVTPIEARKPHREGVLLKWFGTITGPASYTNPGGDTLNPTLFGMTKITAGILTGCGSDGRVYIVVPQADGTAKLKAFTGNGVAVLTEVANAVNLSGSTVTGMIIGK